MKGRKRHSELKDKYADKHEENKPYGDSTFLALNDSAIKDYRSSEKDSKRKIIDKMLTLRHNMKYNQHLVSVYMKAKELFDKMIEEHRMQIHSLEEIYNHLNHLIRENLSAKRIRSKKNAVASSSSMMTELMKDKKRTGALLKKMRDSYEKLMNIDTVIGVTIQNINEITFIEDDEGEGEIDDTEGDEDEYDTEGDEGDEGDEYEYDTEGDDTEGEQDEGDEYEYDTEEDEDEDDDEDEDEGDEDEDEDEDEDDEGDDEDEDEDDDEGDEDEEGTEDDTEGDEDEGDDTEGGEDDNRFIGVF
jgi:hypothetical protein